ncbi:hypothetical protein C9374_008883 [Naegleria lovaniensis]|uniref:Uncharacterized protein n=1 Tax=Naegleria lovaniensis TaxID=51637 RepID=A0AA88GKH6_NAELO|nr:uncharacterized protein C9374_008883 [Naegleria lovaniensis]KAG2377798.1 hypothetical protein C9374_008883 [Naegleria lovaniensis]
MNDDPRLLGLVLYDLFKEIFKLLKKQEQHDTKSTEWYELIARFLVKTCNVNFKTYLPAQHDSQNFDLHSFKSRMQDYAEIENDHVPSEQQIILTLQDLDTDTSNEMIADIQQLLIPLSELDMYNLFVHKTVKKSIKRRQQQANKRPAEQVLSSQEGERYPKTIKPIASSSSESSSFNDEQRLCKKPTFALPKRNSTNSTERSSLSNDKDCEKSSNEDETFSDNESSQNTDEEDDSNNNLQDRLPKRELTHSAPSHADEELTSTKRPRKSKLMADSKNHSIIQQEQIDYDRKEIEEAIASNQPMIRYEDIRKKLEDCANTQLDPFSHFSFSKQKAALVNYEAFLQASKKPNTQTIGYFNNYFDRFPKLFYTLPKTEITGATIFIKRALNDDSDSELLKKKLKTLPIGYPDQFKLLSTKYEEYLQQQKK